MNSAFHSYTPIRRRDKRACRRECAPSRGESIVEKQVQSFHSDRAHLPKAVRRTLECILTALAIIVAVGPASATCPDGRVEPCFTFTLPPPLSLTLSPGLTMAPVPQIQEFKLAMPPAVAAIARLTMRARSAGRGASEQTFDNVAPDRGARCDRALRLLSRHVTREIRD